MATPVGTNELNSLSRRFLMPTLVDNVYRSNLLTFRLLARNKKKVQGGLQIEVPLMFSKFTAGGPYQGFDLLDIVPQDTVKNGAWDWKQYYSAVVVDGLTLIKANSPEAVVDFLSALFEQAQHDLIDKIGDGVWSNGSNAKAIDGVTGAVDDGTVLATYAGLARASNTWWRANVDSATATLTLSAMQTMFGNCTEGGRHPTLIVTTQANYNRYVGLNVSGQAFPSQPGGQDEQLASAGFTNLLFNNVPVTVDSKVPANHLFFLNEDYISFVVSDQADFTMKDFREPINQDAMVSQILWAGNLIFSNLARQGKMTAVTA